MTADLVAWPPEVNLLTDERLDAVLSDPRLRLEFRRWARFVLEGNGCGTVAIRVSFKEHRAISFGAGGEPLVKTRLDDPSP